MKKLWIDDIRSAPEGYVWCKSVDEAIDYIMKAHNKIELIDLDHDAGKYACDGGDYINILIWLEQLSHSCQEASNDDLKQVPVFHLHSMNSVGVQNMRAIIRANNWREV